MLRHSFACLLLLSILFAGKAHAAPPDGSVYLEGGDNKQALILAHGRGKHPTWLVVDPLRKGVHQQLGYHTLSLQMPNADKHYQAYAEDFSEAFTRFEAAIDFLVKERGVRRIYLMGHSMGARMSSAFQAEFPHDAVAGLIVAGCRNNGGVPLACNKSLANVQVPVLDIWGAADDKDAAAAREREEFVSDTYQQIAIDGANHKFEGHEEAFVSAVIAWLRAQ